MCPIYYAFFQAYFEIPVPHEALTTAMCFSFAQTGVNDSIKFYCEAKNARGISVSRTGTVNIKGETYLIILTSSLHNFYCCNSV